MKKIDIINQLNEFGLSIFVLDDAYRSSSGWSICYANFSDEEKTAFINVLKNKFNILSNVNKDKRYLYIPSKYSKILDEIILRNIPNDLDIIKYKILNKKDNKHE